MRKPAIENIEIVEPPIGELTKQRNSFKRTCLTGCGCVIFLIAGVLGGIKLYIGSGPATLKTLPANFPSSIPMYEKDSVESITFISGKYKNHSIRIATFFPKVILSPILLRLHNTNSPSSTDLAAPNIWNLLTEPDADDRDTVQIEWKNMDAEPSFVASYFRKEMQKHNYLISDVQSKVGEYSFSFSNDQNIGGNFIATGDEENHPGTDYASLTVNIPPLYQNPPTQ